jgi:hypothetical protein
VAGITLCVSFDPVLRQWRGGDGGLAQRTANHIGFFETKVEAWTAGVAAFAAAKRGAAQAQSLPLHALCPHPRALIPPLQALNPPRPLAETPSDKPPTTETPSSKWESSWGAWWQGTTVEDITLWASYDPVLRRWRAMEGWHSRPPPKNNHIGYFDSETVAHFAGVAAITKR